MQPRKIATHFLFDGHTLSRYPIVSTASDGTITDLSLDNSPTGINRQHNVEFFDGILMPDLTNAHCHSELSYLKGVIAQGGGLTAFARSMASCRNLFTADEQQRAADRAIEQMWREGAGCLGDICNGTSSFAAKQSSPILTMNFAELFGLQTPTADHAVEVANDARQRGLRASVTPHSTYSLQLRQFEMAVGATPDMPLSIHFLESEEERELYKGTGAMHARYNNDGRSCDFTHLYASPTHRLIAQIPANRDVLLVHGCAATDQDIEMIDDHFSGRVTWVVCPRSNRYISGNEPPVELLRRHKAHIAVGTDSLASNTSLSIVEELKAIKGVELTELLRWATRSGAEALGMGNERGTIAVGRKSGLVLLQNFDPTTMSLTKESTTLRLM